MSRDIAAALGSVLIIGGGRMGQAICAGLLQIDGVEPDAICVANPGEDKRRLVEESYGVRTVESGLKGLPADTIIIAVKPKVVLQVAQELKGSGVSDALIVSIAAGVSTFSLAAVLGNELPIIRVMPNTPLQCGFGMSAISASSSASDNDCELVREVFSHMGHALVIDEELQDVACAISGSGPAYFELFCETIAREGERLGLAYETALQLALQTMYGTAALIDTTHQSLPEAIEAVSSPGGTTVAALDAMRSAGLEEALQAGVQAATRRSKELGA